MKKASLIAVDIKQDDFNLPTPEVLQEQNLAIYDLIEDNYFELVGFEKETQNYSAVDTPSLVSIPGRTPDVMGLAEPSLQRPRKTPK